MLTITHDYVAAHICCHFCSSSLCLFLFLCHFQMVRNAFIFTLRTSNNASSGGWHCVVSKCCHKVRLLFNFQRANKTLYVRFKSIVYFGLPLWSSIDKHWQHRMTDACCSNFFFAFELVSVELIIEHVWNRAPSKSELWLLNTRCGTFMSLNKLKWAHSTIEKSEKWGKE